VLAPRRAQHRTGQSPTEYLPRVTPPVRTTLWRVLAIQAATLLLLWLLQSRYAS
jgi:hypothetical protein